MLLTVIMLQLIVLCGLAALWMRRSTGPATDPRHATVPDQIAALDHRSEAVERHLRESLMQVRTDLAAEAHATRAAHDAASGALRGEVLQTIASLGAALQQGFDGFRGDNKSAAENLRAAVGTTLEQLTGRFTAFASRTRDTSLTRSRRSTASWRGCTRPTRRTRRSSAPRLKAAWMRSPPRTRRSSNRCARRLTRSCTPRCIRG